MTDKELIRRALMGDQEAQKECTEKGIVLPCWRCGGESEIQELHTGGKPIYAVTCKKTYCGAYGCAHSTQQKAIEYWNTRPAPPVGRCGECALWKEEKECPGSRGCPDPAYTVCGKEFCALWNEAQGRCGLACASQSKQAPILSVADKQHSGLLEE